MDSRIWYLGFVVAYVFGFLTCDLVLLKGQLLKSLTTRPQTWILPQRDLPSKIADAFPETSREQYSRVNLMAPSKAMTEPSLDPEDAFSKLKDLKKTLLKRTQDVESIQ